MPKMNGTPVKDPVPQKKETPMSESTLCYCDSCGRFLSACSFISIEKNLRSIDEMILISQLCQPRCIYSFNKHLSDLCYMPGFVLGVGNIKTAKNDSCLLGNRGSLNNTLR